MSESSELTEEIPADVSVPCDYCSAKFDRALTLPENNALKEIHIKLEHTYTAECPLCGAEIEGEGEQHTADLLALAHALNVHFKDECGYCGHTEWDKDSQEAAQQKVRQHILDAHPGILDG